MRRVKTRVAAAALALAVTVPFWASSTPAQGVTTEPNRVLIVLFDQMVPKYADQFNMPNFRALRGQGTYFKNAYLGYMASETVISHNVIVSGQLPANQGWVDEAYRDTDGIIAPTYGTPTPVGAMHITGDFGQTQFNALVSHEGYPKLQDYLHRGNAATQSKQFIVVGEKNYAVRSAIASTGGTPAPTNLIAVHMSGSITSNTGTIPGPTPGLLRPASRTSDQRSESHPGTGCPTTCGRRAPRRTAPRPSAGATSSTPTGVPTTTAPWLRSRRGCIRRRATASSPGPTRRRRRVTPAVTCG